MTSSVRGATDTTIHTLLYNTTTRVNSEAGAVLKEVWTLRRFVMPPRPSRDWVHPLPGDSTDSVVFLNDIFSSWRLSPILVFQWTRDLSETMVKYFIWRRDRNSKWWEWNKRNVPIFHWMVPASQGWGAVWPFTLHIPARVLVPPFESVHLDRWSGDEITCAYLQYIDWRGHVCMVMHENLAVTEKLCAPRLECAARCGRCMMDGRRSARTHHQPIDQAVTLNNPRSGYF